jgi:hypothetical protein
MLAAPAAQRKNMRSRLTVARCPSSNGSYLIGADVVAILSSIAGISAITVDKEVIDGVNVSYESNGHSFDRIDQLLDAKGLRRV